MSYIEYIWKHCRAYSIVFAVVVLVYAVLHVVKLELFPLQLFPMYSMPAYPQESHQVYRVYQDDRVIDNKVLTYRDYTYLLNTVRRYDDIRKDGILDEDNIVKRFYENLGKPHEVQRKDANIEQQMTAWLRRSYGNAHSYRIYRYQVQYQQGTIVPVDSTLILSYVQE